MKRLGIAIALVGLCSATVFAAGAPEFGRFNYAPTAVSGSSDYDFNGIVGLSNCSGSIVRFDDSQDEDVAMILTNGHCVRMIDPGVVLTDVSSSRTFDVLGEGARKLGEIHATKLLYATMTKTDMGLYQLRETYRQIKADFLVDPLTLSRAYAGIGSNVDVISGYWKRGYSCEVDAFVYSLKEGNWLFQDSVRYSRPGCDMVGGTSGSPVIASGTRVVVAVNNTGNENGQKCKVNNPCEIDQQGNIHYEQGLGYAQQTSWVYSCRNGQGRLDLTVDGCQLPKPNPVTQ